MRNKFLDCTALTVAIIGAINWGLIGFFRFDLVAFLFGHVLAKQNRLRTCRFMRFIPHFLLYATRR